MKNISFLMSGIFLSQLFNGYLFWRSNALLTADSFLLGFQACIPCHVVFLDLLEKEREERALACAAHPIKQILCKDSIVFLGGDFLWRGEGGSGIVK